MIRSITYVVLLSSVARAKVEQGTFSLTSLECEHFVSKFSYNSGDDARVSMQFGGHGSSYAHDGHPHNLMVAVYSDEAWEEYTKLMKSGSLCSDRMKVATQQYKLKDFQPSSENDKRFEVRILLF
jgi:hypothetical protein